MAPCGNETVHGRRFVCKAFTAGEYVAENINIDNAAVLREQAQMLTGYLNVLARVRPDLFHDKNAAPDFDVNVIKERAMHAYTEQVSSESDTYIPQLPWEHKFYLTDSKLEFLEVDAADAYSLELCALAYSHRDYRQLKAAGYKALPKPVRYDPTTLEYSPEIQAKRDHVQALREGRVQYEHATTRNIFDEINQLSEVLENGVLE